MAGKPSSMLGMLRTASIFGQKPDASTSDMGGYRPTKRLFGGIGPEPKTPWQQVFDVPKFQLPEIGNAGPSRANQMEDGDFWSQLQEMNKPGPAMSEYQEALRNQPKYEDYKPSGWRIAAAALGGVGGGLSSPGEGAAVAENINRMPYQRAKESWSDKVAGLGASAQLEQEQTEGLSKAYTDYLGRQTTSAKNRQDQENKDRDYNLELRKFNRPHYETQTTDRGFVQIDPTGENEPRLLGGRPTALMTAQTGERGAATGERNAATAEGNLGVNQYNAQTQRGQLGVSEANFNQRQVESGNTERERQFRRDWDQFQELQPDPGKESTATGLTLQEMAESNDWKSFITQDKAGNYIIDPDWVSDSPAYKRFYNEYKRRIEEKQRTYQLPQTTMPMKTPKRSGIVIE